MMLTGSGLDPVLHILVPIERELLIFAAFWFVVGLVDEFAIDCTWAWLRLTGRCRTARLPAGFGKAELSGPAAVLIPAFQEASVIATTIAHMAATWPQREVRFYVGCFAILCGLLTLASLQPEAALVSFILLAGFAQFLWRLLV